MRRRDASENWRREGLYAEPWRGRDRDEDFDEEGYGGWEWEGSREGSWGDREDYGEGNFGRERGRGWQQGRRYGYGQGPQGRYGEGFGDGWYGSSLRGRFYGKAPKGYTRSDERVREDLCDRLMHGEFDPSNITVQVENGEVTLEGHVESRQDKYRAEELAEAVLGVKDVTNHLRIRRGQASQEAGAATEGDAGSRRNTTSRQGSSSSGLGASDKV